MPPLKLRTLKKNLQDFFQIYCLRILHETEENWLKLIGWRLSNEFDLKFLLNIKKVNEEDIIE